MQTLGGRKKIINGPPSVKAHCDIIQKKKQPKIEQGTIKENVSPFDKGTFALANSWEHSRNNLDITGQGEAKLNIMNMDYQNKIVA